jgi:hypothetical protein
VCGLLSNCHAQVYRYRTPPGTKAANIDGLNYPWLRRIIELEIIDVIGT